MYWYIFRPHTTGVKCLIACDNEYLLIQTSYSGKYWTLPGGGVGHSESFEEAAKREVKEELGITLQDIQKIGAYESTIEYKKDTIHIFYAKVHSKELKENRAEISIARWFPKDELPGEQSRALKEAIAIL